MPYSAFANRSASRVAASGHARSDRFFGFGSAMRQVAVWRENARQRRALAVLSPERLADIGMNVEDARIEADRPFRETTPVRR